MAHRDLRALRGMQNAEVFANEIFGFHVQQAVEKSLKAWMCAVGITYPFTHQISRLLVLLRDAGAEVEAFWWLDEFTIYAHQARYEERIDGYDVTYRYHGRLHHTRMPYDPGKRVRVRTDVSPANTNTQEPPELA